VAAQAPEGQGSADVGRRSEDWYGHRQAVPPRGQQEDSLPIVHGKGTVVHPRPHISSTGCAVLVLARPSPNGTGRRLHADMALGSGW